jgi:dTDP-4-dehydrorhamnose reductase
VNFVATAVRVLGAGKSMRVVDDQVGAPTSASTLAHAALLLAEKPDIAGLLHVTDAGVASWYDVACCVLVTMQLAGRLPDGTTVTPVDSSAFPRPAKRPQVSILDTHSSRAQLGWTPPHWREGVIASTQELLHA